MEELVLKAWNTVCPEKSISVNQLTQIFLYATILLGFVTGVTQMTVGKQIHKLPYAWAE